MFFSAHSAVLVSSCASMKNLIITSPLKAMLPQSTSRSVQTMIEYLYTGNLQLPSTHSAINDFDKLVTFFGLRDRISDEIKEKIEQRKKHEATRKFEANTVQVDNRPLTPPMKVLLQGNCDSNQLTQPNSTVKTMPSLERKVEATTVQADNHRQTTFVLQENGGLKQVAQQDTAVENVPPLVSGTTINLKRPDSKRVVKNSSPPEIRKQMTQPCTSVKHMPPGVIQVPLPKQIYDLQGTQLDSERTSPLQVASAKTPTIDSTNRVIQIEPTGDRNVRNIPGVQVKPNNSITKLKLMGVLPGQLKDIVCAGPAVKRNELESTHQNIQIKPVGERNTNDIIPGLNMKFNTSNRKPSVIGDSPGQLTDIVHKGPVTENTGFQATDQNAMSAPQKSFTGPSRDNPLEIIDTCNSYMEEKPKAIPESDPTAHGPSTPNENLGKVVYVKDPSSKTFVKIAVKKKADRVPGSKPVIVCSKLDAKSGHAIKPQSDYVIIAGKATNAHGVHGAKSADELSVAPHVIQTPTGKIQIKRLGHGINIPGQTTWDSMLPNQKEANAQKGNAPPDKKIVTPLLQSSDHRMLETPEDNKIKLFSECNEIQNVEMQNSAISPAENEVLDIPASVYTDQSNANVPTWPTSTPQRNLFDSFSISSQNDKAKELEQAHVKQDDRNVPSDQNVKTDTQDCFTRPDDVILKSDNPCGELLLNKVIKEEPVDTGNNMINAADLDIKEDKNHGENERTVVEKDNGKIEKDKGKILEIENKTTEKIQYFCSLCFLLFKTKGMTTSHIRRSHNITHCKICEFGKLWKRVTFSCDRCHRCCKSKHGLRNHIKLHKKHLKYYKLLMKQDELTCTECKKILPSEKKLMAHKLAHNNPSSKQKVPCEVCGLILSLGSMKVITVHSSQTWCFRGGTGFTVEVSYFNAFII